MVHADAFAIPGSTRFRKHEHDTTHICAVIGGGFMERDGRSWRDVGPGTVRISGAASHDIDFSSGGATCLVLEHAGDAIVPLSSPTFLENDARLMGLAHQLGRVSNSADAFDKVMKDDLVTELLAQIDRRLRRKTISPPPWLVRIREVVHDTSGSASVSDLAREAGVHRVHVARTFRDHYGISVSTYARRVRVQKALRLLASDTLTLSQLAFSAGFADQSHLTRELRAATGATPASIRARLHRFKT